VLLLENLPRRFGHAATDRQSAYMTEAEIQRSADRDPLAGMAHCAALTLNVLRSIYRHYCPIIPVVLA
jgi:TPP-dependent pyruvate/acetoin dehydrogenase alpha subunit